MTRNVRITAQKDKRKKNHDEQQHTKTSELQALEIVIV